MAQNELEEVGFAQLPWGDCPRMGHFGCDAQGGGWFPQAHLWLPVGFTRAPLVVQLWRRWVHRHGERCPAFCAFVLVRVGRRLIQHRVVLYRGGGFWMLDVVAGGCAVQTKAEQADDALGPPLAMLVHALSVAVGATLAAGRCAEVFAPYVGDPVGLDPDVEVSHGPGRDLYWARWFVGD